MMARCAKALKFLMPFMEKFSNPDYVMSDAELDELQKQMREIVDAFLKSPANIRTESRAIADDIDGLYRLGDLITQFRDGLIKLSMKTTVSDVQKRLAGIKVILNRELGAAPRRKPWGLIVLVVLLAAGWFMKGAIRDRLEPLIHPVPDVESPDAEAQTADGADEADGTGEVGGTGEAADANPEVPADASAAESVPADGGAAAEADAEETSSSAAETAEPAEDAKNTEDANTASGAESVPDGEISPSRKQSVRTWIDRDGRKVKGRLLFQRGDMVYLELGKGAKTTERGFRIDNFSEKDQKFIRKQFLP